MDNYIFSNKLGFYSQSIAIILKVGSYLLILGNITPDVYGDLVFELTIMGFALIISDSGGSSAIFSHAELNGRLISQYFSSSINYSVILALTVLFLGVVYGDPQYVFIYLIISLLVIFSPSNNVLLSVLQKYGHLKFFYFSKVVKDIIAFIIAIILIFKEGYELALFLPMLIGEMVLFIFLFFIVSHLQGGLKYFLKIERGLILRSSNLFLAKVLNYFSLNWIYLNIHDFGSVNLGILSIANSIWRNFSDSLKNIFQKNYIMVSYETKEQWKINSSYFWKFNLKHLVPLIFLYIVAASLFLFFFSNGVWQGAINYVIIYGIYGVILFVFPPLSPVYILKNNTRKLLLNAGMQFLLSILVILIMKSIGMNLMLALSFTLLLHVFSFISLYINLTKLFENEKS